MCFNAVKWEIKKNLYCDYFILSVELTGETQERGLAVMSEGIRNSWLTIEQLLKGSQELAIIRL